MEIPISTNDLGTEDLQDADSDPDDIPLAQLFRLPPNTRFFFSKTDDNISWKQSTTMRDPQENTFLGQSDLPEDILQIH
ncbi:unnamed protein product, partial [Acanthoscelides obtectus]